MILVPIVLLVSLCAILNVEHMKINCLRGRYTTSDGIWPLLTHDSGNIKDLRFVCVARFERWEKRRSKYIGPYRRQVVGAKAYVGLPHPFKNRKRVFVFGRFSREVLPGGNPSDSFPRDLYESMLEEVRAFAQSIGVEFKSDSVVPDCNGHPVPERIEEK
jgi:hypothetical protein